MIGVAGAHFVTAYLNAKGCNAVMTTRNMKGPDVFARLKSGKFVALQVKTSAWAMRERGRKPNKTPSHYEWETGAGADCDYYALVDLKWFAEMPDVFFVPSKVISDNFKKYPNAVRKIWKPRIDDVKQYKNNLELLGL